MNSQNATPTPEQYKELIDELADIIKDLYSICLSLLKYSNPSIPIETLHAVNKMYSRFYDVGIDDIVDPKIG